MAAIYDWNKMKSVKYLKHIQTYSNRDHQYVEENNTLYSIYKI